jgi:hypothetical protein
MDAQTQQQVLALERLGIAALRQRYADVFGEATRVANKAWLIKRIAWRLQALAEGDLSERARKRAAELADDAVLLGDALGCQAPELPKETGVARYFTTAAAIPSGAPRPVRC